MAKKRSNKSSEDYWREREAANRAKGIKDVKRISSDLKDVYIRMMQEAQRDIEAFYQRYADAEGISLAEARKRASQLDIAAYAARAKRYVASKDLSDEANAEMRLYNMTMRVNRLDLLRAEIGLALVDGFEDMAGIFDRELLKKSMDEFERLSGILGMTLQDPVSKARQIVDASFHNATWSERLWKHQDSLKTEIGRQLTSGLIAGRSSEDMARQIRNVFGVSLSNAVRLMSTEFRRVQTDAAKASYEANGNEEYEFMAVGPRPCPICQDLNGQIFKVSEMMPGRNAPPMHPRCHCCTAPYAGRMRARLMGIDAEDVRRNEFEGNEFTSNVGDEKNRTIRSGEKSSFEQYGRTVYARKINNSGNNLHIDKSISLSRKQIRDIDGMISRAKELLGISYTCNTPFVITDNGGRIASYNPRSNIFFIDYSMTNLDKVIEQQRGFAAPDSIYSTVVHELFHWKDAEDYRQNGFVIDRADFKSAYSQYNRSIAKRELKKAGIDLSDPSAIASISKYAYLKWLENDLEEVYTEYRTKELLKE